MRAPFLRQHPRLRFAVVTAAAAAGMALTASLGRWQLDRAAQKETLRDAIARRGAMPPLDAAALRRALAGAADRAEDGHGAGAGSGAGVDSGPSAASDPGAGIRGIGIGPADAGDPPAGSSGPPEALLHRAVLLRGRWLPGHAVYLDNRPMDGRTGFYVLAPLRLEPGPAVPGTPDAPTAPDGRAAEGASGGASPVVLVQRGWIPRDFADRDRLQPVGTPAGPVEVAGRIAAGPPRLLSLGAAGDAVPQGDSPIRQNLDLAAFRRETGLPLLPATVVQTAPRQSDGLLRAWPEADSGVEKHHGYAFQWFGLCALIAILYVWNQLLRRFVRPRRPSAGG